MSKSVIIIEKSRICNKFLKLVSFIDSDESINDNGNQSQSQASQGSNETNHEILWDDEIIDIKDIENLILSNCKLKELTLYGGNTNNTNVNANNNTNANANNNALNDQNIAGLCFTNLIYLNISFNKLTNIDFLINLNQSLLMLDVSHNKLTTLSILKDVNFNLNVLRINNNQIDNLCFLKEKSITSLVELWCSCNKIEWQEFYLIRNISYSLHYIVVYDNPATSKEGFYAFLYGCCSSLKRIDHQDIQLSTSVTGSMNNNNNNNNTTTTTSNHMGSPPRGQSLSMTQQKQYDSLNSPGTGNFMRTTKGKVMITQARALLMKQHDGVGSGIGGGIGGIGGIGGGLNQLGGIGEMNGHGYSGSGNGHGSGRGYGNGNGNDHRSGSSSVLHGISGTRMATNGTNGNMTGNRPSSEGTGVEGRNGNTSNAPYKVKTYKVNKSSKNLMKSGELEVDLSVGPMGSLSDRVGLSSQQPSLLEDSRDDENHYHSQSHHSPSHRHSPHHKPNHNPANVQSAMQAATIANNPRTTPITDHNNHNNPNNANHNANPYDSGAPLRVTRFGETTDAAISCHISTNGDGYCKWSRAGALACSYESRKLFASYPNGTIAAIYDDNTHNGSIMDSKGHSLVLFSREDGSRGVACVAKLMNPSNGNIKEVYHSNNSNTNNKLNWKFDGLVFNFDPNSWEVSVMCWCMCLCMCLGSIYVYISVYCNSSSIYILYTYIYISPTYIYIHQYIYIYPYIYLYTHLYTPIYTDLCDDQ